MSAVETPVVTTQVRQTSAAPLGLAAFALNLFLLALAYTGLLPATLAPLFVTCAIFYGAGEFVAGFLSIESAIPTRGWYLSHLAPSGLPLDLSSFCSW